MEIREHFEKWAADQMFDDPHDYDLAWLAWQAAYKFYMENK